MADAQLDAPAPPSPPPPPAAFLQAQQLVDARTAWRREWTVAVELSTHVLGRAFGFQVVNAAQEAAQEGECVPATTAVAADHLIRLLKDRAAVVAHEPAFREQSELSHQVLHHAVESLYEAIFRQCTYEAWQQKSHVQNLTTATNKQQQQQKSTSSVLSPQDKLVRLALFLCLWTEAANLRHTPELLWLVFHMMVISKVYVEANKLLGLHDGATSCKGPYALDTWLRPSSRDSDGISGISISSNASSSNSAANTQEARYKLLPPVGRKQALQQGFVRGVLLPVRNALGNAARVGALLEEGLGPYSRPGHPLKPQPSSEAGAASQSQQWWRAISSDDALTKRQILGLRELRAHSSAPDGWSLAELVVEDVAFFGDGCVFLDMVVQPVFNLMAEQIALMGDAGEAPALRLGYDDFNESACMPQVIQALAHVGEKLDLVHNSADPWDALIRGFVQQQKQLSDAWYHVKYSESSFIPILGKYRYPRDKRRMEALAVLLRDAGAGGGGYNLELLKERQKAAGVLDWQPAGTGGSMPVVHLHASQRVTNKLWANLFKKSFVETRSIGAVAVAFSRVYILHAVLLCWMTLLAYCVPDLSLYNIFRNRDMWTSTDNNWWTAPGSPKQQNWMVVLECLAWGLVVHAVLHVLKDLTLFRLLRAPKVVREFAITEVGPDTQATKVQTLVQQRQGRQKQAAPDVEAPEQLTRRPAAATTGSAAVKQVVQPPTHTASSIYTYNACTAVWWLCWTYLLVASHVPQMPPHAAFAKALTNSRTKQLVMPVWGLFAVVYVGLLVLQQAAQVLFTKASSGQNFFTKLLRKEDARVAEHFFPFGAMSESQDWHRALINTVLWVVVLLIKVLFDFFVVMQPIAQGPVKRMVTTTLGTRNDRIDAAAWVQTGLVIWSLWVTTAFLVFYDTGLFWSVVSGVYSTYILGVNQRIGKVKSWYDLVATFPRLALRFQKRLLPKPSRANWYKSAQVVSRPVAAAPDNQHKLLNGDGGAAATAHAPCDEDQEVSMLPVKPQSEGSVDTHRGRDQDAEPTTASKASTNKDKGKDKLPLEPLPPHPSHQVNFAQAWDEIIKDLRSRDLLNNEDVANLTYSYLGWTNTANDGQARGEAWMLLPRFMAAGAAVEAHTQGSISSLSQRVTLAQSFNLLLWVLMSCGMVSEGEVASLVLEVDAEDDRSFFTRWNDSLRRWLPKEPPTEASKTELVQAATVLVRSKDLLQKLEAMLKDANTPFLPLEVFDKKSYDEEVKALKACGHKAAPDIAKMEQLLAASERYRYRSDMEKQLLFEEVLKGVNRLADMRGVQLHGGSSSSSSKDVQAQEDPSFEPKDVQAQADPSFEPLQDRPYRQHKAGNDPFKDGERMDDVMQDINRHLNGAQGLSDEQLAARREGAEDVVKAEQQRRDKSRKLLLQVVRWLLFMLQKSRGEAAPKSSEAKRSLTFFATSLSNPLMPAAQPVGLTRSMTTLTPHYGEDVTYALSGKAAKEELQAPTAEYKPSNLDNCFLFRDDGEATDTLRYLSIVYSADWKAFRERLLQTDRVKQALASKVKGRKPTEDDIEEGDFLPDKPLYHWRHEFLDWASMRGQLLKRTVHGMTRYEAGLQQLAIMQLREDFTRATKQIIAENGLFRDDPAAAAAWQQDVMREAALLVAQDKYRFILTSQVLGEMGMAKKASERWLAYGVRELVAKRYPSVCIAYIDLENVGEANVSPRLGLDEQEPPSWDITCRIEAMERNRERGGKPHQLLRQYSVLLQYSSGQEHGSSPASKAAGVRELYRVRLPMNLETNRGVILGEGKPENQNHAIIFCFGESVQTIDCNQDNFFVEALKLPSLLAEFELHNGRPTNARGSLPAHSKSSRWCFQGNSAGNSHDQPERKAKGPALVGFREWVFSADSGALAVFAAATERSFGTTVQRVMYNPGGVRFHYGHPDVWDKLFTMTNGGVSKSTKSLHVSEDVFGGYNVMLRGRDIIFRDYFAVGKGRDMGLETIVTFEAKVAAGNGEQVVSRDVSRLARRMNMPRLLSWYFTGNGFFINTALLMYSMLISAWLCLLLVFMRDFSRTGVDYVAEIMSWLGGVQLLQIGSLGILVYVLTVSLEQGLVKTLQQVLQQIVAGSMLFFVFRSQSSAAAFKSDLAYGGATYAATGRGYKLNATPFIDLFQDYGRSHMWYGGQLLIMLVVALACGLQAGVVQLLSTIIAIVALMAAPFWFNPFTFCWNKNTVASREFVEWMSGNKPAGRKSRLWRQFNNDMLAKARNDGGKQLPHTPRIVAEFAFMLPGIILVVVAMLSMLSEWWMGLAVTAVITVLLLLLLLVWKLGSHLERARGQSTAGRFVKFGVNVLLFACAIALLVVILQRANGAHQPLNLFKLFMKIIYVEFEFARFLGRFLIALAPQQQWSRRLVDSLCWVGDLVLGMVLLLGLFLGSLFGLLTRLQAAVLFSMAFSNSYMANENLKHSELGRLAKELKDLLYTNQQLLAQTGKASAPPGDGAGSAGGGNGGGGGGDGAPPPPPPPSSRPPGTEVQPESETQTAEPSTQRQPSQTRPPGAFVAALRGSFEASSGRQLPVTPEAAAAAAASQLQVSSACHLTKHALAADKARVPHPPSSGQNITPPPLPSRADTLSAAEGTPFASAAAAAATAAGMSCVVAAAAAEAEAAEPAESPKTKQDRELRTWLGSQKARDFIKRFEALEELPSTLSWTDSTLEPQASTLTSLTDAADDQLPPAAAAAADGVQGLRSSSSSVSATAAAAAAAAEAAAPSAPAALAAPAAPAQQKE